MNYSTENNNIIDESKEEIQMADEHTRNAQFTYKPRNTRLAPTCTSFSNFHFIFLIS